MGRLIPAGTGMPAYRKVKVAHFKNPLAEEAEDLIEETLGE
jgi:hypothetical protein